MGDRWLLRNDADRERMLDMDRRIAPLRTLAFGFLAIAILVSGPWIGFAFLPVLLVVAVLFAVAQRLSERVESPGLVLFGVWALSELSIAGCIVATGGPSAPALSWLALPVVTLPARFSSRATVVGVAFALLLLVLTTVPVDLDAVLDDPSGVIAVAALIPAAAVLSIALARSDIEHRDEAILDPLTQLLNRKALEQRAAELTEQSLASPEPIGVVIGDIDHFKTINDTCGHATGDAVLRAVALLLRKELRAFDLIYRMGGEEFLVLLPGADANRASDVAERLRKAVAAQSLADHVVTMSFGAAATEPGERFDLYDVAGAADRALYLAKADGRDCVRTEDPRLPVGAVG